MPTKILVIDNFDSFTFNLVHYLEGFYSVEVNVLRNNELGIEPIENTDAIVISPGPGLPCDAAGLKPFMALICTKKVLGVCLGMQILIEYYGGGINNLKNPIHGQDSECYHNELGVYQKINSPFKVGRYHSWVADSNIPECFQKTAWLKDGTIMGLQHKTLPITALQFHPESVLTIEGMKVLENWIFS